MIVIQFRMNGIKTIISSALPQLSENQFQKVKLWLLKQQYDNTFEIQEHARK